MRLAFAAVVLFVSFSSSSFAVPPTCPATPTADAAPPLPLEAAIYPLFTNAFTQASSCTKTVTTLCSVTKPNLASLQLSALATAVADSNCAASGIYAAGGTLNATDKTWYQQRAAFWNTLYSDMVKQSADVTAGTYSVSTYAAQFNGMPAAPPNSSKTEFQRTAPIFGAVAGLDWSGASSTDVQAVFHASAIFDIPLSNQEDWIKKTRVWFGGQLRIAGMAQPGALKGNLGDVTAIGSYLATAANAAPDKIVQSVEASANVAWQMHAWEIGIDSLDSGTADKEIAAKNKTIITISVIGSGGAITPLSPSQANPPVYVVNNSVYSQYGPSGTDVTSNSSKLPASCDPGAATPITCYVSFVPIDRNRFYRHYEGGLRLKMYGRDFGDNKYRAPAVADLSVGGNEYVTGGQFKHPVLHFGGWVPIPKVDAVYIFGSMDVAMARNDDHQPLILVPSTAGKPYSDPSVHQIYTEQPDRDRYMFGFGIDLYHLIAKTK